MNWFRGLAKDWGISLAVVLAVFVAWSVLFSPKPQSSGAAPDFVLPNVDGTEFRLENYADRTVVLNFWFTSCGPCVREIPELAAFHTAHPEIPMFGISVDRNMTAKHLGLRSARLGINYPVLHDEHSHVASSYGVNLFPTTFVIRDGEIQTVRMGEVDQARLERMAGL